MSFDTASELNAKPAPKRGTVWQLITDSAREGDVAEALERANSPSAFGRDSVSPDEPPGSAWGAIFIGHRDREISQSAFLALNWYFERDGAEANVFEYDPFYKNFVRLHEPDITLRKAS